MAPIGTGEDEDTGAGIFVIVGVGVFAAVAMVGVRHAYKKFAYKKLDADSEGAETWTERDWDGQHREIPQ